MNYICELCKKSFQCRPSAKMIFCSRICYFKYIRKNKKFFNSNKWGHLHSEETKNKLKEMRIGKNHPHWKGGIKKTSNGYVCIYSPTHPFAVQNYVLEHRLVMEKMLGRYLTKKEIVHHINGDKNDNRKENLKLFENDYKHLTFHKTLNESNKHIRFLRW